MLLAFGEHSGWSWSPMALCIRLLWMFAVSIGVPCLVHSAAYILYPLYLVYSSTPNMIIVFLRLRHSICEQARARAPGARASSRLYPASLAPRDFSPCRLCLNSQTDVFNNTQCFTSGNALAASHFSHDFELQALKCEIEGNPVTSSLRVALQNAATVQRHCTS